MITAYIAWTISTTVSGNVFVVALGAILAASCSALSSNAW